MLIHLPPRPARRTTAWLLSASLLTGCAQGPLSTQSARIGNDDGSDRCRANLVALDSTGNYFGEDILKCAAIGAAAGGLAGGIFGRDLKGVLIGAGTGALLGGAAGYWSALQKQSQDQAVLRTQVRGDLERENAQIDRTQIAFDALTDCRFREAQMIQADYKAKRIDRPTAVALMAQVKQRAERDLAVAKQINAQIAGRAEQYEVAAENLEPGTKAAIAARPTTRPAVVQRTVALKLRPDPSAPDVGQLEAKQSVKVGATRSGFALVETPTGSRGYAPADAFQGGRAAAPVAVAGGDVRTLAGSNAALRDDFAQRVAVTEQAVGSGFELAG
jgi:hypothetical protein